MPKKYLLGKAGQAVYQLQRINPLLGKKPELTRSSSGDIAVSRTMPRQNVLE